jgi:signal transduction histidine kinase
VPRAQDALFQHFIRGDKARLLRGSGLGLSLAAAVTRLHGFALSIENTDPRCPDVAHTCRLARCSKSAAF